VPQPEIIVIGVVADHVVVCFREKDLNDYLALYTSATWGEFRRRAPTFAAERIHSWFDEDSQLPSDSEELDVFDIPGALEGDLPSPVSDMLGWMPAEIRERFGQQRTSRLSGEMLEIHPDQILPLTAALELRGYKVVRDDERVSAATGN